MTRRGLGHKPIEYDAARLASLLSGWLSSNMPIHDHSSSLEGGDDLHALEEVEFNDAVLLTIATGIITRSQVYHQVDTEASGAIDDLDTVQGGAEGDLLILRAANSARTVMVKHGTGNIRFASGNDYTLDDDTDHVALVFDGADWCDIGGAGATIVDHALLSATHTDTLAAAVVQGDLNVGNATPAWARLAIGANETILRSDGTSPSWVALFDATNPISIDVGDTAAVGTAATAPRRDHQHAVTSSSNPGAAASILATDASGFVQVLGLGVGATPPVGNRITLINNGGIQIASGVLLRFSITPTPDQLQVYSADVYIATTAHGIVHVDGNTAGHVLRANGTRFVPSAIQAGDLPGAFAGFANPTASVGLSAVNGSATTAMRNDAAPALSQGITPTWTGLHTFNASIAMTDDTWIGIGAAAGRLAFDSTPTPDQIRVLDADMSIEGGNDLILYSDAGGTEVARVDGATGNIICGGEIYRQIDNSFLALTGGNATGTGANIELYGSTHATEANNAYYDAAQHTLRSQDATATYLVATSTYISVRNDLLCVNETSNAKMTTGLTLNQGAADDEILAIKSSGVAHGMTDQTETDTYGFFRKAEAASGGLEITGIKDADGVAGRSVRLRGFLGEAADTAKTTAGIGVIELASFVRSGTSVVACGADANLVTIANGSTTRFIFDAEGSAHSDIEWATYDEYDDMALLADFETAMLALQDPVKTEFADFLMYNRRDLEQAGIVHFDVENPGHAMVNWSRLAMLFVGTLRQMNTQLQAVIDAGNSGRY